jgi:hypothetical protein
MSHLKIISVFLRYAGNHYPLMRGYYYYRYSALGPVWAEFRAQSGDWYGSGTLHPAQILRGSLPLLSPRLDVPTFATKWPHVRHDARNPSGVR